MSVYALMKHVEPECDFPSNTKIQKSTLPNGLRQAEIFAVGTPSGWRPSRGFCYHTEPFALDAIGKGAISVSRRTSNVKLLEFQEGWPESQRESVICEFSPGVIGKAYIWS